ncbi:hypothetical protein BD410DRAFT_790751 [Rickenella mellea]|uniref:Uncharacterized protein n=1 Tax=Rickenella mellea TaxID=50990 RepID=A0A4Y7Q158_9AGAM|nr:hypothetical protein BD410DRAFT_790751 [Rickenella mellea]
MDNALDSIPHGRKADSDVSVGEKRDSLGNNAYSPSESVQFSAKAVRTRHGSGIAIAAAVAILSGCATALGVFLIIRETHVGNSKTDNCHNCWNINSSRWNTAVAFYGSVLGAAGALLLRILVTYIAQRQLVTNSATSLRAFRPLKMIDLIRVVQNRKFALQRGWAIPILVATFLSSSATIALLGVNTQIGTAKNTFGSATIGLLNYTSSLFYTTADGSEFQDEVVIDTSNFDGPVVKAASIASLKASQQYTDFYAQQHDLLEGGRIGNSTYDDVDTGGIGVNVGSYLRYSGSSDYYQPPTNYTFNRLTGVVWGINTTVSCTPSDAFTISLTRPSLGYFGGINVYNVTGPGYSFAFATTEWYSETNNQPWAFMTYANLSAYVGPNLSNGLVDPTQPTDWMNLVVVIPDLIESAIFVCGVTAEQYLASIEVAGVAGSVVYTPLGLRKDVSGPFLSQKIVQFLYQVLNLGVGRGVGQSIHGFSRAEGNNNTLANILSDTLSAASRIYITLNKQHFEQSSAVVPGVKLDQTYFLLEYSLQRIGGGTPWVFLPVLLFITSIVAAVIFVGPRKIAMVDVTDPVAVAAVMMGSSVPQLRGRGSGNYSILGSDILDDVELVLRTHGENRVEFTTAGGVTQPPEIDRDYY